MALPVDRRRVVQASCTAGILALAGCLGGDDDENDTATDDGSGDGNNSPDGGGNGDDSSDGRDDVDDGSDEGASDPGDGAEPRPYPEYLAANDAGEVSAAYADFGAIQTAGSEFDSLIEGSEDPLLLLPAEATRLAVSGSAVLDTLGLGPLVGDRESNLDSEVDALLLAGGTFVALGTLVPGEIAERLRQGSGQQTPFGPGEETGAYTIYEATGEGTTTVAVSNTDIVVAGDRSSVERTLAAVRGERERATESIEAFGWVLDAVDDPDVVFAGHGTSPDSPDGESPVDALSDATSFVATHTFGDDRLSAEAAAVYPSAEALEDATGRIETTFGSDAQDVLFDFEPDRVSVTGTYHSGTDER